MTLVVCPGCNRHVSASDARCPFCAASTAGAAVRAASGRLSRRLAPALVATAATGISACFYTGEAIYGAPLLYEDDASVEDAAVMADAPDAEIPDGGSPDGGGGDAGK